MHCFFLHLNVVYPAILDLGSNVANLKLSYLDMGQKYQEHSSTLRKAVLSF